MAAPKYLIEVTRKARMPEHTHLAEKLTLHAQNEEEIPYPAALLVGEYIKLKEALNELH